MYNTIKIGGQVWMLENLSTEEFSNGDKIFQAKSVDEWISAGINNQPAWCHFNNDEKIGSIYGKLYNWFAVNDLRGLSPYGFHVPNNDDWIDLIFSYGDESEAGNQMRCRNHWDGKWFGIDKEEGFNALPAGYRANGAGGLVKNQDGSPLKYAGFNDLGKRCSFWSASNVDETRASSFSLDSDSVQLIYYPQYKGVGFSVRCIQKN